MTKTTLAALTFLATLAHSPAQAKTDLEEDWTDNPAAQRYQQPQQRQQYAARTECELPERTSGYSSSESKPESNPNLQSDLMERVSKALAGDCGKVRMEKNQLICEDYSSCRQSGIVYELDSSGENGRKYIHAGTVCREWQMKERWKFDPAAVGKVEALLIDTQYVNDLQDPISLSYALRPAGKNELYLFRTESAAREVKRLINNDEGGK